MRTVDEIVDKIVQCADCNRCPLKYMHDGVVETCAEIWTKWIENNSKNYSLEDISIELKKFSRMLEVMNDERSK